MTSEQMRELTSNRTLTMRKSSKNITIKTTINSRRKLMHYAKEGIWQGIVTVTGSWYRAGNVIESSGVPTLKLLLCILKFHPASPVIAMDKLLRMEPLGAYKPEVFEEFNQKVHLKKGAAIQLGIMTGRH